MKRKRTTEPDDVQLTFPPPVGNAAPPSTPTVLTAPDTQPTSSAAEPDRDATEDERSPDLTSTHRHVVTSASVIMLGNLLSSVLGMVRLLTISTLFYGGASGSFNTALRPVQQVSDLVVGGSVSGALIPTFVDYAAEQRRAELRNIYCTVANLVALLMALGCALIYFTAPYFIPLETQGYSASDQQLAIQLVRITSLSLLGLGLYSVGAALLYALKQVKYPAFATGVYHVGIIVCGVLVLLFALSRAGVPISQALHPGAASAKLNRARSQGAQGLAIGAAVGAMGEFLLLLPALRHVIRVWRPILDLRHPAVRQILRLYAPLAVGLIISVAAQNLDLALTNLTPGGSAQNLTSMVSAGTLIQFPVGLVSAALSFSVLPLLVPAFTTGDIAGFKRTLRIGFRLGLLLMVPAMVGLIVLRTPIMVLLFQHGLCDRGCTYRNTLALQNMAFQLPFIAIDQLLIAAYYARKNTLTPTIVGVLSIGCYAVIAVPFSRTIGLPAMAFANAVQNSSHAIILFVLLTLAIGSLGMRDFANGAARICLAAAGLALTCLAIEKVLPHAGGHFAPYTTTGALLTLIVAGVLGSGVYIALIALFRVHEVRLLLDAVSARLRGHR